MNLIERLRGSVTTKVAFIGFLMIILLIPVGMLQTMINERQRRHRDATFEIASKWGQSQKIIGPVLTVPYRRYVIGKDKVKRKKTEYLYFLPDSLEISGDVKTQKRHRGIFEAVLYSSDLTIKGKFSPVQFQELRISASKILWQQASVNFAITDNTGIKSAKYIKWNKRKYKLEPSGRKGDLFDSGLRADLQNWKNKKSSFELSIQLKGSRALNFVPVGRQSEIRINSPWIHPSFVGKELPQSHTINDKGFSARWSTSHFTRQFPDQWTSESHNLKVVLNQLLNGASGVDFFVPVNHYHKSERALKYALLFIALTFLSFFIFEIFQKLRIHPLQYMLVGLAMCLFYLLFLSLSEHVNFQLSYVIAAVCTIGTITGYCRTILGHSRKAMILTGILTALYGYLFVLLHNEDYTLMIGAIALFAILAAIMYITRNIDWYDIKLGSQAGA